MTLTRKRVTYLTPLPNVGGTEKQTLALTNLFVSKGWRVGVLGSHGPLTPAIAQAATDFGELSFPSALIALWHQKPAIVHCQMARTLPLAIAAKIVFALWGRKLGLVYHARAIKPSSYRPVVLACRLFSIVTIANSKAEQAKMARKGLPDRLSFQANNLIEPTNQIQAKVPYSALIVARLSAERGIDLCLRAFAKLDNEAATLTIVGEGPERQALETLAQTLGIASKLRFVGQTLDPSAYFERASIYLNTPLMSPEFGAGHGNALIEAAMAGMALISFDGSSAGELVISGQTGELVKTGDQSGLDQALNDLMQAPERCAQYGSQARAKALSLFDAERSYAQILEAYEVALSKPR